ncbi:hypothetical protein SASPL_134090 [Salvia splendens]|uniref:Cyclic nucleotide-binding domain-containing protein n=1 Tax=Salvia splendens TaxID=180675 RepID=A0A8X8ZIL4_SALSN|nr:hypothetical protein SASPL_134090 [Salvia splendens]
MMNAESLYAGVFEAMDASSRDEAPMLPASHLQSDNGVSSARTGISGRTRSVSMSFATESPHPSEYQQNLVGLTGPLRAVKRNPQVQMSGPLHPNRNNEVVFRPPQTAAEPENRARNGDGDYVGKNEHLWRSGQLGKCSDPYCTACPMFYDAKGQQKPSRTTAMIDAKFRLAYVAPETRVAGSGDLVDDPKKIAWNYFTTYFPVDLLVVLPMPQVCLCHLCWIFTFSSIILLSTSSTMECHYGTESLFYSWANFLMNLLTYILASHVVGSCWYLLSIQRVNKCLENACDGNKTSNCTTLISCSHNYEQRFADIPDWIDWKNNENASACFTKDGFDFGICEAAVNLTTHKEIFDRYLYSLFWGFQQISTLAGNQEPSYMPLEVIFTMFIIGIGLLLFALLIGNMQNFLQALGRRRLEKSLRGRDVEQWMSHRRLPKNLRRQVRAAERFNWSATRGVNEDTLIENLPEDLQREIRRHLFKFVKKVRIFQLLDEPVIDAIQEKLKTRSYIRNTKILYPGGLVDKIVFIIRGEMKSTGEDGNDSILSEGDVCGEELLTWCLEHSSVSQDGKSIRLPRHGLLSDRHVTCLTNVEAFVLRAADFEEVAGLFTRFLKNPLVQGAIRYDSPHWRGIAARRIQLAWRHRRKQTNRVDSSQVGSSRSPHNLSYRTRSRRK